MINIITGTPYWVYLLFAVLVVKGIKAMKASEVSLKKLFILPAVFVYLSVSRIGLTNPGYYLFLLVGALLGWIIYKNTAIEVDRENHKLLLPGSVIPMILIMFAFAKGYFIGYYSAVNPEMLKNAVVASLIVATSGISAGIFIGRTLVYVGKYFSAKDKKQIITKFKNA